MSEIPLTRELCQQHAKKCRAMARESPTQKPARAPKIWPRRGNSSARNWTTSRSEKAARRLRNEGPRRANRDDPHVACGIPAVGCHAIFGLRCDLLTAHRPGLTEATNWGGLWFNFEQPWSGRSAMKVHGYIKTQIRRRMSRQSTTVPGGSQH